MLKGNLITYDNLKIPKTQSIRPSNKYSNIKLGKELYCGE